MISKMSKKFDLEPIIAQVNSLGYFKRLELNQPSGEFFNDPWSTKEEFLNTPLGNVLKDLGDIGQARLLALDSGESYTAHCDPDDRIHLAIHTNPYSFLVDLDDHKLYHLPADGQLWHMDTSRIHVASNWGPRTRIHLNIRVLLPKYNETQPGLCIKVIEGDYDWKQLAYTPIMRVINNRIKKGYITGFRGISDKEILINTTSQHIFENALQEIKSSGVILEIKEV